MIFNISGAKQVITDESGATAIEYGLIGALIAIVIIAGASSIGKNLSSTFNNIASNVATAGSS